MQQAELCTYHIRQWAQNRNIISSCYAMDPTVARIIQTTLNQLQAAGIYLSDLILYVLHQYPDPAHPHMRDLVTNTVAISSALYYNNHTSQNISEWAHHLKHGHYLTAIRDLARKENGWHFGAAHTQPDQIREFQLEEMTAKMYRVAPELCDLVQCFLGSDGTVVPDVSKPTPAKVVSNSDDDLWEAVGYVSEPVDTSTAPRHPMQRRKGRKVLQGVFVRIVCIIRVHNTTSC